MSDMNAQDFSHTDNSTSISFDLSTGQAAQLDISAGDIQSMTLTPEGNLLVSLTSGSSLVITDFSNLAAGEMRIALADGSFLDTGSLYETLSGGMTAVRNVPAPEAGLASTLTVEPGVKYNMAFNAADIADIREEGGVLIISFDDNGSLVLMNFADAMAAENAPQFVYQGAFTNVYALADALDLVETEDTEQETTTMTDVRKTSEDDMTALAESLSGIEPAAGEGSSRGGFGFQSAVDDSPFGSPDAIGPIGPTALQFGAGFAAQQNLILLPPPPPSLNVGDTVVLEDGSVLLSISSQSNDDGDTYTVVQVAGIPASWAVDANGGVYNSTTGIWTITIAPGQTFSGGPILSPPADSDIDLNNLKVTATNFDTGTGLNSAVGKGVSVTVDAVADTPDLALTDGGGAEDTDPALTIATSVTDTDGSEAIDAVFIRGVPDGFTLSAGINNGGGEWQLTQAELVGLTINAPAHFSGSVNLSIETIAAEVNTSGGEPFTHNNTANNTGQLTVTWTPVADAPLLNVSDAEVKEDQSVFVPVEATLADADGSEFLTVTVKGVPVGWNFAADGFAATGNPGEYQITLPAGQNYDGGFTLTPPADSDLDLTGLQITATSIENGNSDSASTSQTIDVIVDAVADTPDVTASDNTGNEDTAINVDITALLNDTDGSESFTSFEISGVPAGFSFNQGADHGGGVWCFTPAEIAGLQMSAPANFFGDLNLTVTGFNAETNISGGETDTSDNTNSNSGSFTLTWLPVADPPEINVNGGVADVVVKEDGSVDVPLTATLDPNGSGNEALTVTVSGIDAAWGFSAPVGTYNAGTGTWTVTLGAGQNLSTLLTFVPPADSDLDLSGLSVTASAFEPATGTTASDTDSFDIIVDAVADAPDVDAANASGNEDTAINVDITALLSDTDGSESFTGFEISGVPAGFSFNQGADHGGGVWYFTPAEIAGLQMNAPAGFFGDVGLTATGFNAESNISGGEPDTGDNTSSDSDSFTLSWLPVANTPEVKVNGGVDNAVMKEDGSVDVPVLAALGPGGSGNEVLTVTVSGINPAWGFSAPVGTYNAGTGVWTVTLPAGQNLGTVLTFTPPANSDIDLSGLVATASAFEPATGTTASHTDGFNILVDAVADTPDLAAANAGGEEGTVIALNISTNVTDTDGSESIDLVKISNVPAGTGLTAGTEVAPGVWELSVADLAGLGLNVPDGVVGSFTLNVESVAKEAVSDGETDTADNTASAFDTISLTIEADDVPVVVDPAEIWVDETDVFANGSDSAGGTLTADFGTDGPGTFVANGTVMAVGHAGVQLTSNGAPVTITQVVNGYVGTANGTPVFTLTIDADTGNFNFNLTGGLDHPNTADPNDLLWLKFGFDAVDADGDHTPGIISVDVNDDGPQVASVVGMGAFDEAGLENGPISLTRNLSFDFGEDGAGTIEPTGQVMKLFQMGGSDQPFTSNGTPITINATANGYEGVAGGQPVFTLVVNPLTGQHTYTQFAGIDHPDGNNPDDVIWFKFGMQVVDADGDTKPFFIQIDLHDDAPVAVSDSVNVETQVTGNLIANDDVGADQPGHITEVTFGGNTVIVPGTGTVTINGNHGTLEIAATGAYTYTSNGNSDGQDVFGYTLSDADGDTSSTSFTVTVDNDDVPVVTDPAEIWVDETDVFANGSDSAGGTLIADFGTDGPGTFVANGTFMSVGHAGVQLTSDGVPVTITQVGNGYVGTANGTPVFTLTIDANTGNFNFTLTGGLDHPNTADPNDISWLKFGFDAVDADGDRTAGTISVDVKDDGPQVASVVGMGAFDEAGLENGPISLTRNLNFDFGEDGAGTIQPTGQVMKLFQMGGSGQLFTSNGTPITINTTANGYEGVAGGQPVFTLVVNPLTGQHTYTQYAGIDHPDGSNPDDVIWFKFGMEVVDADGDSKPFFIQIDLHDDAPVAISDSATVETQVTGNLIANDDVGADQPGHITEVTFGGNTVTVPGTGTVTINGHYGSLEIAATGTYTYTSFNNTDGQDVFAYTLSDADGDTSSTTFTVTVNNDDVPVVCNPAEIWVDETVAFANGSDSAGGTLTAEFGADGPGTFEANGTSMALGHAGGQLTSNGVPVAITQVGNGYVGTANGTPVFTLTIDANTGNFNFNLTGALDHANIADPDDILWLKFGFDAVDADGDRSSGIINVDVKDDGPQVAGVVGMGAAYESGMSAGPLTVTRNLSFDFGQDGAGRIEPTGQVMKLFQMGGSDQPFTADGTPITINATANGYEGVAGGTTIFTLVVNPLTGQHTYTQYAGIDHPDGNNPDDVIWFKFGMQIVDADGDTKPFFIQIDLHDDGPVAHNDLNSFHTADGGTNGNVITGLNGGAGAADDLSQDHDNLVTWISFGGTTLAVPDGGSTVINGNYGTLEIFSNGTYNYTVTVPGDTCDEFTYTLADADGDSDTATLRLLGEAPDATVDLTVNGDVDNAIVKEDGSIFIPVSATVTGGGDNDVLTLTVTGVDASWNLAGAGWTPAGAPGTYSLTLPAGTDTHSGGFTLSPPTNSDVDLTGLNVTASLAQFGGATVTDTDGFNVIVDAVADVPDLTANGAFYNYPGYGPVFRKLYHGGDVAINIAAALNDTDGSESITHYTLEFLNKTHANLLNLHFNHGAHLGNNVWLLSQADLAGLQMEMGTFHGSQQWASQTLKITVHNAETNLSGGETDTSDNTASNTVYLQFKTIASPLVLDLDGNGVDLTSIDNGVNFDMNGDGQIDYTAWVSGNDGFLALDNNGDGAINDRSELFGTEITDGFTVLAGHDLNGDGIINVGDSIWGDLLIWRDVSQDGVSQAEEMFTLDHFGIAGINLDAAAVDYFADGNWISHDGTFIYADGSTGQIVDAWFQYETAQFEATDGSLQGDAADNTLRGTDYENALFGHGGDDRLYGLDGDDILSGGAGDDILYGGGGADRFIFDLLDSGVDILKDFAAGDGDVLDLSALLEGADFLQQAVNDFVFTSDNGTGTVLAVDLAGSGNAAAATDLVILEGVSNLTLEEMIVNGSLLVA